MIFTIENISWSSETKERVNEITPTFRRSSETLKFEDPFILQSMENEKIQIIPLDHSKYPECELKQDKYYMIKEVNPTIDSRHKPGEGFTYFFPSLNFEFIPNEKVAPGLRYEEQLGYIECKEGYIDMVLVTKPPRKPRKPPINARQCGISTVLTALCMIDPELNLLPQSKMVEEFWDNHPKIAATVRTGGCKKFIGLFMMAYPIKGAYAYFSAAITWGYNKMYVEDNSGKYGWMDTSWARSCFDETTGKILEQEGLKMRWWFCEEIPEKFPKIAKLDPCSKKSQ